jgi:hypothetical protein
MTFTTRNQKRWQLVTHLRVFDYASNELIGHLFDVTSEGIRLISEQPITTGRQYHLKMDLPDEAESLTLNAQSVWCQEDINPEFWDTGFKLLDVSNETKARIEDLIAELKATQS